MSIANSNPVDETADAQPLPLSAGLQRVSYRAVQAAIVGALPGIDPLWADSAARLQVYGVEAGLAGKHLSSCLSVLAAADAALSGTSMLTRDEGWAWKEAIWPLVERELKLAPRFRSD